MAVELNLDKETVRQILSNDLGMKKVSIKMDPSLLTEEQKQRRADVFRSF
jgi:hypothetical protein